MKTIEPVGVPHEGCVKLDTVGTDGACGTASIVTIETAAVIQVLSMILRTVKL